MISVILGLGAVAVLITVLIKEISYTMRTLACWTFGAIASAVAAVVYYSGSGGIRAEIGSVISGLCGAAIVLVIAFAIELLSPTKRLSAKEHPDYDRESAENALNIVMVILAASAAAAAAITDYCGAVQYSVFGIIPAIGISVRQLSYFMYRVKLDTLRTDDYAVKRAKLIKRLSTGKRRL